MGKLKTEETILDIMMGYNWTALNLKCIYVYLLVQVAGSPNSALKLKTIFCHLSGFIETQNR